MSLNLMGLGFSFGAKDDGLEAKQKSIADNFDSIASKMSMMNDMSKGATAGAGGMSGSEKMLEGMAESNARMVEQMGEKIPEATRTASEQFKRDANEMESDQRKIGGGFNFIRDAMEKLSSIARQNKLQTFVQAISLSKLNDVADAIGGISQQGMNLTTGLEGEMVSLGKSTRATGANFGYTGQALAKFSGKASSMAKALNVDANTAALALRGWDEAGSELAAMGFKNAKEVAKFSDAMGVNADTLRNSGLRMRKELQMSDEQINRVMGSFTAMGQAQGDVNKSLETMPQMMDMLSRRAATMGKALDAEELSKYAASTAALGAGFMNITQDSDKAREMAMAVSQKMLEGRENFGKMFGGTSDDISDFQKAFGIATGSIETAFDSMKQGPDEFVSGIAKMVQEAKASGKEVNFNVIQAQMQSVFGEEQAAMMAGFFRSANDETLSLMANVKDAPAQLGKLANEAHRTGRTLAESFDLAQERFRMSFRSIARDDARAFVKETSAEFTKFSKKLKEISGKGGAMGAFVDKMSEAHQLGAMAFIPQTLRPMASLMGNVVSEMTPAVAALGAMGFRLKMLISPFALVASAVAGLGLWFAKLKMEGMSTSEAFSHMGSTIVEVSKKVGKKAIKAFKGFVNWFQSVDWSVLGKTVLNGLVGALEKSNQILKSIPWKKIWKGAFEALGRVWDYLLSEEFRDLIVRFAAGIGERVAMVGSAILWMFEQAIDWISKIQIGPIVSDLMNILTTAVLAVANAVGPLLEQIAAKLPGLLVKAGNAIIDLALQIPAALERIFLQMTAGIDKHGAEISEKVFKFIGDILKAGAALVVRIIQEFPEYILKVGDMLVVAVETAIKAILSILTGLENYLVKEFPNSAGTIRDVFMVIKGIVYAVGESIKFIIQAAAQVIKYAFIAVREVVVAVWWVIKETAMGVWQFLVDQWNMFAEIFGAIWTGIQWAAETAWSAISWIITEPVDFIIGAWESFASFMGDLWDGIASVVTDPIGAIKELWGGLVDWFSDKMDYMASLPGKAWDAVKDLPGDIVDGVGGALSDAGDAVGDFFTGGPSMHDIMMSHVKMQEEMMKESRKKALAEMLKTSGESEEIINAMVNSAVLSGDIARKDSKKLANELMANRNAIVMEQARVMQEIPIFGKMLNAQTSEVIRESEKMKEQATQAFNTLKNEVAPAAVQMAKDMANPILGVFGLTKEEIKSTADTAKTAMESADASVTKASTNMLSTLTQAIPNGIERGKELLKQGMEKLKEFSEEFTPAKSIVVNAKDMRKIGPTAQRAFGRAGKAMDAFGGKASSIFELSGKKSLAMLAIKAFNKIQRAAHTLRSSITDIWQDILDNTRDTFDALMKDIRVLHREMRMLERASQGGAEASVNPKTLAQEKRTFRTDQTKEEQMLQATHWPDWYVKSFHPIAEAMKVALESSSDVMVQSASGNTVLKRTKAPASVGGASGMSGVSAGYNPGRK